MSDEIEASRRKVEKRVAEELKASHEKVEEPGRNFPFIASCIEANEMGDGALFVCCCRGLFAFNHRRGLWMVFDGVCWRPDTLKKAEAAVEAKVVSAYLDLLQHVDFQLHEAVQSKDEGRKASLEGRRKKIIKRIDRLRTVRGVSNTLSFAITNAENLGITGDELDEKPYFLACKNGVINLQTGALLKGRPEDYLSMAAPVAF